MNDLKKIFFGASSVAKSAADSTGEFIKEEGGEILDKGMDLASEAGKTVMDKSSQLKDAVMDNSGEVFGSAKDKLADVAKTISDNPIVQSVKDKAGEISEGLSENPLVQSAQDKAEQLGSTIMEKGSELTGKFGEVSEKVGEQVLDKGAIALDKGKDLSESVGEKVLAAKDRVVDRASEIGDQISTKLDETMEKAEKWEAEEAKKPKREFAENDLDAGGSLLEGTDDFFAKADKFASGDYDAVNEGKIEIQEIDNPEIIDKKPTADIAGFEDLDGDGNPLIDDLDIIDEGGAS